MSDSPRPRSSARRAGRLGAAALASALVVGLLPTAAGATLAPNEYSGTTLNVVSDDADPIAVTCGGVGGDDLLVNGMPPDAGTATDQCGFVEEIVIVGGPLDNAITVDATSGTTMSSLAIVSIDGAGGDDTIELIGGPAGADLIGGSDSDTITVHGAEDVNGGPGEDMIVIAASAAGGADVEGGADRDRLSYVGWNTAVSAVINTSGAALASMAGIEDLAGGSDDDTLTGDGQANLIDGGPGDDTIDGGAGADSLTGSADADTITFGTGDVVLGGTGNDTFHPIEGQSAASLNAGADVDTLDYTGHVAGVTANLGTSTVTGVAATQATGLENVTGGGAGDSLTGTATANVLLGAGGDDTLVGAGGADTLTGGGGTADEARVAGTAGADTITAGAAAVVVGAVTTTIASAETVTVLAGAGNDGVTVTPANGVAFAPDGGADTDALHYVSTGATAVAHTPPTITASNRGTVTYAAFETVSLGAPVNTVLPTISGTAEVGETLTAGDGTFTGDPTITTSRQWVRCNASGAGCVDISGETATTYVLDVDDIGATIRVRVTANNDAPGTTVADSLQTAVVADLPGTPAAPGLAAGASGALVVTFTAPAANGSAITSYVVRVDGAATQAASGSPHTVTGLTTGVTHTIEVAAVNGVGQGAFSTASIAMPGSAALNTLAPVVSGTATVGSALSATIGTWSGFPAPAVTRQWQRCNAALSSCTAIPGATGTSYTLTAADVLARVRVVETGTNLTGAVPQASNATAAVLSTPTAPAAPTVLTGATGSVTISWAAPFDGGSALTGFDIRVNGGTAIQRGASVTSLTIGGLTPGSTVSVTVAARNAIGTSAVSSAGTGRAGANVGYWMLERNGHIYRFGGAADFASPTLAAGVVAVDAESTPSGNGLLVLTSDGAVFAFGDAPFLGGVDRSGFAAGERVSSISITPSGTGYWVFTNRGRVVTFGNAQSFGDLTSFVLNGPVLDAVPTPSGNGYYMVGSDGGVFSFGDAAFYGSMGGQPLNKPVVGLVPDPDGVGYWMVASDGGVFAFEGGFRGSMGGTSLNQAVNGMIPYGNGYLMVASDGGVFNFATDLEFQGSLGATPPANPIVAITALG